MRAAAAPIDPPALARTAIVAAALLGLGATGARAQDGSWLEQETATGNWGGARERYRLCTAAMIAASRVSGVVRSPHGSRTIQAIPALGCWMLSTTL
ncbi:MAG: hypothetical protein ACREJ5_05485 [Geminicoccaceae bacterium]